MVPNMIVLWMSFYELFVSTNSIRLINSSLLLLLLTPSFLLLLLPPPLLPLLFFFFFLLLPSSYSFLLLLLPFLLTTLPFFIGFVAFAIIQQIIIFWFKKTMENNFVLNWKKICFYRFFLLCQIQFWRFGRSPVSLPRFNWLYVLLARLRMTHSYHKYVWSSTCKNLSV